MPSNTTTGSELTETDIRRHFDHTDPRVSADLAGTYATLRGRCPVVKTDAHGGFWAVSRYRDIVEAATKHRTLRSGGAGVAIPSLGNALPALPTESDEPEHRAYRGVIWPFLTAEAVRGYEAAIRDLTNDLLDEFIEDGHADLVTAFAEPLPIQAAGIALGFTPDEGAKFYQWFRDMVAASGRDPQAAAEAAGAFLGFLGEALAEAAERPRENSVITAVVNGAHADGRPFSTDERIGIMFSTAAAAVETTTHAVAHTLNRLADPAVKQRLVDDPELIPKAVEEVLRIDTPNNMMARTAACPVDLGEQHLEDGDRVLLLFGSGNLDEEVFEDPQRFVPDRSPNRHLAFGWGIHKCAGQHFARLEMRIAVEEALRRLPDYRIDGEVPPPRIKAGLFWSLDSLPVRFTPGVRERSGQRTVTAG